MNEGEEQTFVNEGVSLLAAGAVECGMVLGACGVGVELFLWKVSYRRSLARTAQASRQSRSDRHTAHTSDQCVSTGTAVPW